MPERMTQEEVLYRWGISEFSRSVPEYANLHPIVQKPTHSPDERQEITRLLWGYFIREKHNKALVLLGDGQALWQREEATLGELGETVFHPYWLARAKQEGRILSPPTLKNIVEKLGDKDWLNMEGPFKLAKMRGEPILVSDRESGRPWYLMDGCHRLYSMWREGVDLAQRLSIIRGVHPKVPEWFSQWPV